LRNFLHRLISNPEESQLQKILLAPLSLLAILYGWVVRTRIFFYRIGIYRTHSLSCKVISVGNITLGGTGKTPFVILLAEMIRDKGYRTAILSRGYKGEYAGPYGVVSDGEKTLLDAVQAGDEPYLLAQKLKGVPIVVGKERLVSGRFVLDRFKPQVIILDDGFQHLSLKRDLNLLLMDSRHPFGNGKLFPRGELREPLTQMGRADAVILTKAEEDDIINNLRKRLMNSPKGVPLFQVCYRPREVRVWGEENGKDSSILEGRKVLAFAGLARPSSFQKTLSSLGSEILKFVVFPDHHPYSPGDLERLSAEALRAGAEAMITTEKDMVRMRFPSSRPLPLWTLAVAHEFRGNDGPLFSEFLFRRLDLKP
jgi:tetraacyldisaccharide 4'-kinase